jgi:uncharacterized membrane protein YhdT
MTSNVIQSSILIPPQVPTTDIISGGWWSDQVDRLLGTFFKWATNRFGKEKGEFAIFPLFALFITAWIFFVVGVGTETSLQGFFTMLLLSAITLPGLFVLIRSLSRRQHA